ncbi:MAG: PIN domain-containing protein [Thermodesulfobacteriota bacterium]
MILLDTGPIVAFFDGSDDYHDVCVEVLRGIREPLVTTWPVLTEAFYLLSYSWEAQDSLWEFIMRGGLTVALLETETQEKCRVLMEKYRDLPMDLADGTLVAIAETMGIQRVFTLDHRDFGVYRTLDRKKFRLLPAAL